MIVSLFGTSGQVELSAPLSQRHVRSCAVVTRTTNHTGPTRHGRNDIGEIHSSLNFAAGGKFQELHDHLDHLVAVAILAPGDTM